MSVERKFSLAFIEVVVDAWHEMSLLLMGASLFGKGPCTFFVPSSSYSSLILLSTCLFLFSYPFFAHLFCLILAGLFYIILLL